jgi:hypothetical protein
MKGKQQHEAQLAKEYWHVVGAREWIWSDILTAVGRRNCNHTFIGPCQKVAMCPVPSVAVIREGAAILTPASVD